MKPMVPRRSGGNADSFRPLTVSPKSAKRPDVGDNTQPTMDKSVVLPLPDGPTSIRNSPRATRTSTPRRAE